jgi:hypothetical protein
MIEFIEGNLLEKEKHIYNTDRILKVVRVITNSNNNINNFIYKCKN